VEAHFPAPEANPAPVTYWWMRWLVGLAVVGTLGLGVGLILMIPRGPRHPDKWDSRVTDLVRFVERVKGQPFRHPVYVKFLPVEEYEDSVSGADEELDAEEQRFADEAAADEAAYYRAIGLLAGEIDTEEANEQLLAGGTSAYFDPPTDTVFVRGTELNLTVKGTVVHELTHAYQDQHEGLDDLLTSVEDEMEYDAVRTLVEGDAVSVEVAWVQSLPPEQFDEYSAAMTSEVDAADQRLEEVPAAFQALFGSYYVLGQPWAELLYAIDGNARIHRAFENPPATTEHVLDPLTYFEEETPAAVEVSPPKGADVNGGGPLGPLLWFVVLADQLELGEAFAAVRGWDGDDHVSYRTSDDQFCMNVGIAMDSEAEAEQLQRAFTKWAAALSPGELDRGPRSVDRNGPRVDLKLCDPGPKAATPVTQKSMDALNYPQIRLWLYVVGVSQGLDESEGDCFADAMLGEVPFDQLNSPEGPDFESPSIRAATEKARAECT
jgi:hypothetical protein